MKILTKENSGELLGGKPLDAFLSDRSSRLRQVGETYSIPSDSGRKTALSKFLSHLLLRGSAVVLYISGWGVWASSENLDLFYGYRRSFGETRSLAEAPVHVFEPADADAFVSILSMVFYFVWDAWVFDTSGQALVRISHDEWLEIFTGDDKSNSEFAAELGRFGMPVLSS